jgi:hypothetical protein
VVIRHFWRYNHLQIFKNYALLTKAFYYSDVINIASSALKKLEKHFSPYRKEAIIIFDF